MNSFDISIMIIIAAGFVFGLFKGLVRELAGLIAIVLGIYGAKIFSALLAPVLCNVFGVMPKVSQPLSYVILFVTIVVLLLLAARIVDKLFEAVSLGSLNKFLGGVFGALKFALIISVLLNVFDALNQNFAFRDTDKQQSSVIYKPLVRMAPELWDEARYLKESKFNERSED